MSITVKEYSEAVRLASEVAKDAEGWVEIIYSGIIGEFGSVATTFKKHLLSHNQFSLTPLSKSSVEEEVGDMIWYLFALSHHEGWDFGHDVMRNGLERIKAKLEPEHRNGAYINMHLLSEPKKTLFTSKLAANEKDLEKDFDLYQRIASITMLSEDTVQMTKVCLSEISKFVSRLTRYSLGAETKTTIYASDDVNAKSCVQDIFWNLSVILFIQDVKLEGAIDKNIKKISNQYKSKNPKRSDLFFDENDFPIHERFPKRMEVQILDLGGQRSRMYYDGRNIGNDITDNSPEEDGYRFHDALHLTFVAHFGWSPVIRALMKLKRKSNREIDEGEDGARANLVDELVVNLIHAEAVRQSKYMAYEGDTRPLAHGVEGFTGDFLKFIRHLVRQLEVRTFKDWEWKEAAKSALEIFDRLQELREGTLCIDRDQRSIEFSEDLILDLHGVVITQFVDSRNASENAAEDARHNCTMAVCCPELEGHEDEFAFKFHENGPGQYIAQLKGKALDIARRKGVLTVKISQNISSNQIITVAVALGDKN